MLHRWMPGLFQTHGGQCLQVWLAGSPSSNCSRALPSAKMLSASSLPGRTPLLSHFGCSLPLGFSPLPPPNTPAPLQIPSPQLEAPRTSAKPL